MKDVENQMGRVKPRMVIYPDSWNTSQGELDDTCYWELELLSGCPFFHPASRRGGVTHVDGRVSRPVMGYYQGIVSHVVA
eukprot:5213630-Prorocentrum_lima.AAC.1